MEEVSGPAGFPTRHRQTYMNRRIAEDLMRLCRKTAPPSASGWSADNGEQQKVHLFRMCAGFMRPEIERCKSHACKPQFEAFQKCTAEDRSMSTCKLTFDTMWHCVLSELHDLVGNKMQATT